MLEKITKDFFGSEGVSEVPLFWEFLGGSKSLRKF